MRTANADPIKEFRFRVEVDGFVRAGFSEVGGLSMDISSVDYREGGMNDTVQKSPGLVSYGDITLSRGVVAGGGDADFEAWIAQVHQLGVRGMPGGATFRKGITIYEVGNLGDDLWAWDVSHAWPSAWTPRGSFNANSNSNVIESLTIKHEGWIRRRL